MKIKTNSNIIKATILINVKTIIILIFKCTYIAIRVKIHTVTSREFTHIASTRKMRY